MPRLVFIDLLRGWRRPAPRRRDLIARDAVRDRSACRAAVSVNIRAPEGDGAERAPSTGRTTSCRRERRRAAVMSDVGRLAGRLAPDRLARDQRQPSRQAGNARARVRGRCGSSTTAPTRWRGRWSPAGRTRSAWSASTRPCTARRRRCTGSSAPRTRPATSSSSRASRRWTARRCRKPIERLRRHGVDGILVIAPQEQSADALLHAPAGDTPLVAVEAGPDPGGAGGRGRPVCRRGGGDAASARARPRDRLAHHRAADWLESQQRHARVARRRSSGGRRGARRRWSATGARAPATSSAVG